MLRTSVVFVDATKFATGRGEHSQEGNLSLEQIIHVLLARILSNNFRKTY
jgi:hypothetical protein